MFLSTSTEVFFTCGMTSPCVFFNNLPLVTLVGGLIGRPCAYVEGASSVGATLDRAFFSGLLDGGGERNNFFPTVSFVVAALCLGCEDVRTTT